MNNKKLVLLFCSLGLMTLVAGTTIVSCSEDKKVNINKIEEPNSVDKEESTSVVDKEENSEYIKY